MKWRDLYILIPINSYMIKQLNKTSFIKNNQQNLRDLLLKSSPEIVKNII